MHDTSIDLPLAGLLGAIYVNPFKLIAMLVLAAAWAKYAEWADKDAVAVNTHRQLWNMGNLAAGLAVFLSMLLIPNFLIGYPIAFVLFAGMSIAYVVHRNGLVTPESTVLTGDHWRRIQEKGLFGKGDGKKSKREVTERVPLRGPKGPIKIPAQDDEDRGVYADTQDLISDILLRRASRGEVAPSGETARVILEIDGELVERDPLERNVADNIVQYLKRHLGLSLEEKRRPQMGKLSAKLGETEFEIRVRTDGSVAGEKLTFRVIGPEVKFKAKNLGFTPEQLQAIDQIIHADTGLVLVTGPRGSGITTTIYSLTRTHDAFLNNIQLLEYSSELEIDNVTQRQFTPTENATFTDELMKMIRSDPDVLIVPELREPSAATALTLAGTRGLTYAGLPANDAVEAVRKWMKLRGDNEQASKALFAALNQRLIRKLCNECKEAYKPDAGLLKKLNLPADAVLYRVPEPVLDKNGNPILCPACQGVGYVGRTGIFEILMIDGEMRDAVRRGGGTADLQPIAAKQALTNLQRQGLAKVLDGTTSIQELVRVLKAGESRTAKQTA